MGHRPDPRRYAARGTASARTRPAAAPRSPRPHAERDRERARRVARVRMATAVVARGHLPAAAEGLRAPRLQLREAGSDHLGGRRAVPRRAGQRVQAPARPGAPGALRRRPGRHRDRPRRDAFRAVRMVRRDPHRRRLDRPGARGPAAHRRGGRGQGAATAGRAAVPRRHRRPLLAGPPPDRAHPGGRAGQPARPGGALRGDGHRGARLPARSAEHARHRGRAGADQPARHHRAASAPHAGQSAGVGDGTPRRVRVRRRRVDARGRDRHARAPTGRAHRVARGRDDLRRLPRRPARRQPRRATRRPHRAVRLRHDRAALGTAATRVPPAAHVRNDGRPARPAGRVARPRSVPSRRRPRCAVARPRSRRSGEGPDADVGGRPHARDARGHEEVARVRGAGAEGAHALREEHDVPEQRDRDPGARSRHAPADDGHLHVLRRDAR